MGLSIGWLAVHSADASAVYEVLQVRPTNQPDEYLDSPIAGVTLKTGWILFVAQDSERLISPQRLTTLSARWRCLACLVEERVMCSSAAFWSDGAEVWSLSHDPGEGILNLETTGQLPDSFASVRDQAMRDQQAEDSQGDGDVDHIFEIPLLVAKQITGFKHDETLGPALAHSKPVAFTDNAPKKRRLWPW